MTHGTNDVEDAAASEDESGNEGDAEEMQGWKVSGSFFNIPKQDIIFLGGQEDQNPDAAPIDAPLEDASNDASVAAESTDEQLVATTPNTAFVLFQQPQPRHHPVSNSRKHGTLDMR